MWPLILPLYLLTTFLHMLPSPWPFTRLVKGYVCDARGVSLTYRLNGLAVFLAVVTLFYFSPPTIQRSFYDDFWVNLACANALGLSASLWFLLRGGREAYTRCITVDQVPLTAATLKTLQPAPMKPPPMLARFFLGGEWNPRFFDVDVKMWLYLVGAVGLGVNVLSFAVTQQQYTGGSSSRAMTVYTGCFAWFLVEYLLGEEVHFYYFCSPLPSLAQSASLIPHPPTLPRFICTRTTFSRRKLASSWCGDASFSTRSSTASAPSRWSVRRPTFPRPRPPPPPRFFSPAGCSPEAPTCRNSSHARAQRPNIAFWAWSGR